MSRRKSFRILGWRRGAWAGFLTGLVSSTFSTLVVSLGARRIGRSARRDWMEVGTVLLGDRGVRIDPGRREIAAGLLVHQSADIAWATLYGAWLGSIRPGRRQREALLVGALPWAAATSAIEYHAILPWLQPLLRQQVPYWIATTVHVTSSAAYPLFVAMQSAVARRPMSAGDKRTTTWTAVGLASSLAALVAARVWAERRGEPRWPRAARDGARGPVDEITLRFLRHMSAHHELGVRMTEAALDKAQRDEVQTLARLMLGEHLAELDVMRSWWESWAGEPMPGITAEEFSSMHGMPRPDELEVMEGLDGVAFERRFLPMMLFHHEGAVLMAAEAIENARDPRVRVFASNIRHTQLGQMHKMTELLSAIGGTPDGFSRQVST